MMDNVKCFAVIYAKDGNTYLLLEYNGNNRLYSVWIYNGDTLTFVRTIKTAYSALKGHDWSIMGRTIILVAYSVYSGLYTSIGHYKKTELDVIYNSYIIELNNGTLDNRNLILLGE